MTPEEQARAAMDNFPSLRKAPDWSAWVEMRRAIQAEIETAIAAEREACAKIADESESRATENIPTAYFVDPSATCRAMAIAAAIRARP